jgi:hypothetical protein
VANVSGSGQIATSGTGGDGLIFIGAVAAEYGFNMPMCGGPM